MVMWYIAEPFSPSTWQNAHEPMSRLADALVDGHRQRLVAERPKLEEPVDLVRAHRRVLVAREPRDLGVGVPPLERRRRSPGRAAGARRAPLPGHSGNHAALPTEEHRNTIARMRRWSELAERVAATTRTSEKTCLLADYLRTLDADELPIAVVFLTGRPFPEADQRATGIGWATIANAVAQGRGHQPGRPRARRTTASPTSARRSATRSRTPATPRTRRASPGLVDVAATFAAIEAASGPARKADLLAGLLARADPKTARGIVRVLSGELRIGLREGLVEAALAKAFDRPLDAVKRAGMLTGDIGAHGASRSRGPPRGRRARAVPPAEVHARVAGRGRGRDPPAARSDGLGRGQVRRHPLPAPPRGHDGSPLLPRPARHLDRLSRRSSAAATTCPGPASSTASSSPGATGRSCRSSPSRRGWAGRTLRAAARGGAGHLRRLGRPRARPARTRRRGGSRRRGRADAGAAADRAPAAARRRSICRLPRTAAASRCPTSPRRTRPMRSRMRSRRPGRGATRASWSRTRRRSTRPAGGATAG